SEAGQKPSKPQDAPPVQGNTSDNSGNGSSDSGNGQEAGDNDSDENKGKKPGDNKGDKPSKPEKEVIYTVTYKYQGSVFATQSVQKGKKASAPVLSPAAAGTWDFDFNTAINADTTIEWKSGN
ncbi:MAG: hypothetical protein K2N77_04210, partial [Lachnospiraceae bacterium]|nr:hypothetical protein [Lachnospiraceae bacterium]